MKALPEQVVHRPFEAGPYRMAMGLLTVPEADWFELDTRYATDMAERRRLLKTARAEVFAALPVSDAARQEAFDLVTAALARYHPDWFSRDHHVVRNHLAGESWTDGQADPLELAGQLVQEDLCLIQNGDDGPIFTAAMLCFPSRWRLSEKIGKPLRSVHGPVPFYQDRLSGPVDRLMRHLKAGRIASRLNWSLLDDPTLFQPTGKWRVEGGSAITAENAGQRVYLRVERQTFRRLPDSGAVLFGIRVHVYRLDQVVDTPSQAAELADAVWALPAEMRHYKSLLPFQENLLSWLRNKAGAQQNAPCRGWTV